MPADSLISLSDACLIVERCWGHRPHRASVHRWRLRGIAGVRLRCIWAAGSYRTSEDWLSDFFAKVTAAKSGTPITAHADSNLDAIRRAERELADSGM